ncbi:MAG: cupin domain-containing protein [Myxococcales bacterium]|nr:MAG: cupin domain-containing protein [Myxococcales bacterium]
MTSIKPEVWHAPSNPQSFQPEPGLTRRVLASSPALMLVEHRMEAGWVGTLHHHPHEQLVYVISGRLAVRCGSAEPFEVGAGGSFVVGGDVEHQASASEPCHVLDIFTPAREDYLSPSG